jgi:DNA-binding MarR family transcriptional regulator
MYHTQMFAMTVLNQLDDALIRLRRLWQTPSITRVLIEPDGSPLEMSTVLVTDAINRSLHASPPTAVRVGDIAERLDVAPSTASRLVDRAVRAGMVSRGRDSADNRHVTLTLTPSGSALLGRALTFRTQYLEQVLTGWPRDDVATLARLLDRFAAAVHTHPEPGRGAR